MKINQSL